MTVQRKFIDKKKARVFKVVQRSLDEQDAEAPIHALKEVRRGHLVSQELVSAISLDDDQEHQVEPEQTVPNSHNLNAGEAAKYGVFFDDTEYDYMQHLKKVGQVKDAVLIHADNPLKDSVDWIEPAPKDQTPPSANLESEPTVDPSVREVFEALDDDRYINELSDDFVSLLRCTDDGEGEDEDEEVDIETVDDELDFVDIEGDDSLAAYESACPELEKILEEYNSDREEQEDDGEQDAEEYYNVPGVEFNEDESPLEMVDSMRRDLGDEQSKQNILKKYLLEEHVDADCAAQLPAEPYPQRSEPHRTRWDCEDVAQYLKQASKKQSPNMPKAVRAPKIVIDRKGMPKIVTAECETEAQPETTSTANQISTYRDRNETAEEKRARKAAVKTHKQQRRQEKKSLKVAFSKEMDKQQKVRLEQDRQAVQIKM